MKKDIIRVNIDAVVKSIAVANAAYEKKDKASYTKVAKAIEEMNKTVAAYNNTQAHDLFDSCKSVEDFARIARATKLTIKQDKETGAFSTVSVPVVWSLAAYAAWHRLDNVNVLPKDWTTTVKYALANLAGMVARMSTDVNTDAEIDRINKKYGTDVRGSKNDAKHALQALVNTIMPGYTVTGSDLTKIMVGVFKVNLNTWKISLPTEETLLKVFSGLLAAMVNNQDINAIFDWDEKAEKADK